MNRTFGSHPALSAFLLSGGAFLALYFGYSIFGPPTANETSFWNHSLSAFWNWTLTALGVLLWLAGGVIFGLDRAIHWSAALALQFLPGVGLLVMWMMRTPLTPHEAWARRNPNLDETCARRNFRPMKPLY